MPSGGTERQPGKPEKQIGMPRWVKVSLILTALLVVLIAILLLTGHGPGRHLSSAVVATYAVSVETTPGSLP